MPNKVAHRRITHGSRPPGRCNPGWSGLVWSGLVWSWPWPVRTDVNHSCWQPINNGRRDRVCFVDSVHTYAYQPCTQCAESDAVRNVPTMRTPLPPGEQINHDKTQARCGTSSSGSNCEFVIRPVFGRRRTDDAWARVEPSNSRACGSHRRRSRLARCASAVRGARRASLPASLPSSLSPFFRLTTDQDDEHGLGGRWFVSFAIRRSEASPLAAVAIRVLAARGAAIA